MSSHDCQDTTKQEASVYDSLNNFSMFHELLCSHLSEKRQPALCIAKHRSSELEVLV